MTRGGIYDDIWPEPEGNHEGKSRRICRGLRLYFIVYCDSSYNTDILNYNFSIDPGRSLLEELILCIALTAGQYWNILPSRLSNIEKLNFHIIMFSNSECCILKHPIQVQGVTTLAGVVFFFLLECEEVWSLGLGAFSLTWSLGRVSH